MTIPPAADEPPPGPAPRQGAEWDAGAGSGLAAQQDAAVDAGEDAGPESGPFVLGAAAFVFGLDLGWLSVGALLAVTAWQVLRPGPLPGTGRTGLITGSLLAATLVTYYAIAVAHGMYDPVRAAGYVAICLLAYATGLTASGARDAELIPNVLVAFVFAALGSAIYALLSVGQGLELSTELAARAAPSAWHPEDRITATALGAAASPGLALLAAAVFSVREARSRLWRLAAWAAAGAGLAANALLLNRSPFLALGLALAACAWLFLRASEVEGWRKVARLLALTGGALGAAAWAWSLLGATDVTILARFESEGLETARFEVMWEVLSQLFSYPLGGRAFPISENYAHNLWLDVGYDAGPLPFLLILAFHALHAPAILAVVRRHPSLNARLVTAAALVALGLTAMAEPVVIMSVHHFALGLFLLGGLLRVANALPLDPAEEEAPATAAPSSG